MLAFKRNETCSQGTFITCIDCNMSETAMTRSPDLIRFLALSNEKVLLRLLSISSVKLRRKGIKPHWRFSRLRTDEVVVKAKIGQSGRQRDNRDAMCPVFVYTKSASTSKLLAAKVKTQFSIHHHTMKKQTQLKIKKSFRDLLNIRRDWKLHE